MSDLAERIRELVDAKFPTDGSWVNSDEWYRMMHQKASMLLFANASTILAGLAALEEREKLRALHDAVQKYMQHKNNTQPKIDSGQMDVRMIYRQDVLDALAALQPTPADIADNKHQTGE